MVKKENLSASMQTYHTRKEGKGIKSLTGFFGRKSSESIYIYRIPHRTTDDDGW